MRTATKIWLGIAAFLVITGMILIAAAMWECRWDLTKLSTQEYKMNTYELAKEFNSISIKTDTADIDFILSNDGKCRVECYEREKTQHLVNIQENVLTIHMKDERSWYDYIGIHFDSPKITVYLPKAEYASLLIRESTGDITIPNDFQFTTADIAASTGNVTVSASASESIKIKISTGNIAVTNAAAGALDLSVTTGSITASNVSCTGDATIKVTTGKTTLSNLVCNNLLSTGSTGAITLNNLLAAEKITINRSTGNVLLNRSDAAELAVTTSTGTVKGTLLSEKTFIVKTDTGRIEVPQSQTGGKCQIITSTGNIKIDIS